MDLLKYKDKLRFATIHKVKSVYDPQNKMWRKILPEEIVRQCLYHFLHHEKSIPYHMMKIEYSFTILDKKFRADLVIFDRQGEIKFIAECKAFNVTLKQKQMDQLALYNQEIKAQWLLLTNGQDNYLMHTADKNTFIPLEVFPVYSELIS